MATQLGTFIRERRATLGLTIDEVARKSGLNHSSLSRLENGHTARPHNPTLIALSQVLKVRFDFLLRMASAPVEPTAPAQTNNPADASVRASESIPPADSDANQSGERCQNCGAENGTIAA